MELITTVGAQINTIWSLLLDLFLEHEEDPPKLHVFH
jgi:hypothetical protein